MQGGNCSLLFWPAEVVFLRHIIFSHSNNWASGFKTLVAKKEKHQNKMLCVVSPVNYHINILWSVWMANNEENIWLILFIPTFLSYPPQIGLCENILKKK